MANNVIFKTVGGEKKVLDDVKNLKEVKEKVDLGLGYTFLVNGETFSEESTLRDGDYITASQSVKGGC